ncbi:hypothetical protein EDB85DRAFT_2145547 [Lactarius pseudohatsudake]|nr:hypothetical protein EDB85DRAFT_2145547 [Lactarius pseudohatsudake]
MKFSFILTAISLLATAVHGSVVELEPRATGGYIQNPSGTASFTSYSNCSSPACGKSATGFTAAMSELAFGAQSGLGPGDACGRCFQVTGDSDPSTPSFTGPFNSIVVKVTNLCPASSNEQWCGQTTSQTTNSFGMSVHFELCQDTGTDHAFFPSGHDALTGTYQEEVLPLVQVSDDSGGPSSFYVASRLLSSNALSSELRTHIYDRLWAPHGLVRYGVAPDHPEVKNCTHKFDQAAKDPRLRFFGNLQVGPQSSPTISHALPISLSSLKPHYTHLLFSTGCAVPTLHPALPPFDRVIPALSLVHWYTQHPSRPAPPPLHETEHVSIIGQGNVALDVARMLLTPPAVLAKYDVPSPVLDVLRRSAVRHVSIIGRRGPLQAAFTTKELRELTSLDGTSMLPLAPELLNSPTPDAKLTRQQSRLLQLLQRQQQRGTPEPGPSRTKSWSLDFFRSPTALATAPSSQRLALTLAHTALDASARAVPTGVTSVQHTDLVVTALGHHSDPAAAYVDPALGHLRTGRGGRVLDAAGRALRAVYASGWAATGALADAILADCHFGEAREAPAAEYSEDALVDDAVDLESVPEEVVEGVRARHVVQYDQWKKIDAEEVRRCAEMDKERERMGWKEAHGFLTSTEAWQNR